MQLWTFLHILSMFAAVTVLVGIEWWATIAVRRGDVGALRAYFRLAPGAEKAGGLLFLAGIAFGLVAAMATGWDLLVGWLVVTYVLVVLTIVIGAATAPYLKRVEAALPEDGGAEVTPELRSLLGSPVPLLASLLTVLVVAAIIAMMVFKPTF